MFNQRAWATALLDSSEGTESLEEVAKRFFLLLVKKKRVRHIISVMDEVKNILDKRSGIIAVYLEYALPPPEEFEGSIKEMIKKRTGASDVEIVGKENPELIGGYRLRVGDEIIDASIRGQLRKMEKSLQIATRECPGGDGVN